MRFVVFVVGLVILISAAPLRAADLPITFNNQIIRIFQQRCQSCHRPGNIAPFSLLTYADAAGHASSIKRQIETRQMPPWKPVNAEGVFEAERTLTDQELQTIVRWVDGGLLEGSASDLPEPIPFPLDWTYREPDRVVAPSDAYSLDPAGGEVYRCFSIPVNSAVDLNVRGYEVLPGNREIVHHVLLFIDRRGVSESRDAADPAPGYTCFGDPGFTPDGAVGGWVPGMQPEMFPLGIGVTIPAGSRIVMQVHYSPLGHISHPHESDGPPAPDRTRVGLFLSSQPLRQIAYVPVVNPFFSIPAGASRYLVEAVAFISADRELTAITPHMHLLGREVVVEARFPNGTTRELIHIADWDFEWQAEYTFRQPMLLPAGTIVSMKAWYDNSSLNPRNLSNPPVPVSWGERTTDEMCLTFLSVTVPGPRLMSQIPFTMGDRGGVAVNGVDAGGPGTSGYAQISPQSATGSEGLAIFGLRQNGVLVAEAAVAAAPRISSGRMFAETRGAIKSGIALANPNSAAATVSFSFTDLSGRQSPETSFAIPANTQLAAFLDQRPFNGPADFVGSFSFTSSSPLSVVALRQTLNERSEALMTTLPITEIGTALPAAPLVFPQFADGDGWTTQILLVNPTDTAVSGTLEFRGTQGTSQSSTSYSIPPRSVFRYETSGKPDVANTGSVQVSPANNSAVPSGSLIFSRSAGGVRVTEAGVPAVAAYTAFRAYVESSSDGKIESGIAIANTTASTIEVKLELTNLDGSAAARSTISLPPNGQLATFLDQIPGFEGLRLPFQGTIRILSTGPVSVIGLRGRYNERNDFLITTTPPVSETAPAGVAANERFFAHFVTGGGYTTQFILYSASQSSTGTLQFYSNTGQPISLSVR